MTTTMINFLTNEYVPERLQGEIEKIKENESHREYSNQKYNLLSEKIVFAIVITCLFVLLVYCLMNLF